MEVHPPDPAHTGSERARANFRLALMLAAAFVGMLWAIGLTGWGLDVDVDDLGVAPRTWQGLVGIVVAPLLHAGVEHLAANTLPLVVLGTAMLYLYPQAVAIVLPAIWIGPGLAVWLFARDGVHVGASGLVYGLASYVFVAGVLRRDRRAVAASLLVAFLYGASVWGVLPIRRGVSWETHLAAAAIGFALALALRHRDIPPRRRYSWEDEVEEDGEADGGDDGAVESGEDGAPVRVRAPGVDGP